MALTSRKSEGKPATLVADATTATTLKGLYLEIRQVRHTLSRKQVQTRNWRGPGGCWQNAAPRECNPVVTLGTAASNSPDNRADNATETR